MFKAISSISNMITKFCEGTESYIEAYAEIGIAGRNKARLLNKEIELESRLELEQLAEKYGVDIESIAGTKALKRLPQSKPEQEQEEQPQSA